MGGAPGSWFMFIAELKLRVDLIGLWPTAFCKSAKIDIAKTRDTDGYHVVRSLVITEVLALLATFARSSENNS
jgi:hypothetical protein